MPSRRIHPPRRKNRKSGQPQTGLTGPLGILLCHLFERVLDVRVLDKGRIRERVQEFDNCPLVMRA